MEQARSRYGLCVAALGAALLGGAVFMPWYGPSPRAHSYIPRLVGGLAGAHLSDVDAWGGSPQLAVILLVAAALALLDVLAPLLLDRKHVARGAGGALVLVGSVAVGCTIFRMLDPPSAGLFASSLRQGAWLALIGGGAVVLGGIWPRNAFARELSRELGDELVGLRTGALS